MRWWLVVESTCRTIQRLVWMASHRRLGSQTNDSRVEWGSNGARRYCDGAPDTRMFAAVMPSRCRADDTIDAFRWINELVAGAPLDGRSSAVRPPSDALKNRDGNWRRLRPYVRLRVFSRCRRANRVLLWGGNCFTTSSQSITPAVSLSRTTNWISARSSASLKSDIMHATPRPVIFNELHSWLKIAS
jgi:hypothetical protein